MTTQIIHLPKFISKTVSLKGWVWGSRGSNKVRFIQLRDGSGFVQCVVGAEDISEADFQLVKHLTQESVVAITGLVQANDKAPTGIELQLQSIQVLHTTQNYPITPKEHGTDFLMDNRHLWLRSPRQQAILRIRHRIIKSIRDYFDNLDFTLVDAPIFTPNECEGSSTLFATDYFGENAYLSQSGQLYMEAACQAVGKAYCMGPTFRAENSNTRRHLTEFWMVEPEVAFMDLEGDMELAQGLIQAIVKDVLQHCPLELAKLERDITPLQTIAQGTAFPRLSYTQAVELLRSKGVDFTFGDDFGGTDETIISEQYDLPVIIHRYPTAIKPFYMKPDHTNPQVVLNMDILAPEGYGEIIGGSQREDHLPAMEQRIQKEGMDASTLQWFLDLRRYGTIPHAGFGLGVERTVAWICKLPHVRETIPFPRLPRRMRP